MKTLEQKLRTAYQTRNFTIKVKDVDQEQGIVKGYFSAFDSLDSDFDVIRKGAFAKSIAERGPRATGNRKIAHLRNHDWGHQIGMITELEEDKQGLKFVSKLGRSTKGQDALLDYQDGILREHSIGFNYISDKIEFVEDSTLSEGGHFEITEVKLWEGSGVTFGANEFTPTLEANKTLLESDFLLNLNQEFDVLTKAFIKGEGSDERLEHIELRFKQVKQKYNSAIETLIKNQPTIKATVRNKPNEEKGLSLLLLG